MVKSEDVSGDLRAVDQTCVHTVCAACPEGRFAGEQSSNSYLVWLLGQKPYERGIGAVSLAPFTLWQVGTNWYLSDLIPVLPGFSTQRVLLPQ